ncbi:unnamed protein product [Caenorhabditis auriculariae]|uniref:Uncharacterized protein n=1 Tax=Caenorhabditis auriculariae TaxID=2777116 RepID=A0A8S1HJJ6_9PELO|nr:unnamed protein product [Caenorhabditis auriculariae]
MQPRSLHAKSAEAWKREYVARSVGGMPGRMSEIFGRCGGFPDRSLYFNLMTMTTLLCWMMAFGARPVFFLPYLGGFATGFSALHGTVDKTWPTIACDFWGPEYYYISDSGFGVVHVYFLSLTVSSFLLTMPLVIHSSTLVSSFIVTSSAATRRARKNYIRQLLLMVFLPIFLAIIPIFLVLSCYLVLEEENECKVTSSIPTPTQPGGIRNVGSGKPRLHNPQPSHTRTDMSLEPVH